MSKTLLVIDDDIELGKILEAILKPIDLRVFQACSGDEGLRQAHEIHPDLVIVDVMMPGLDGFEVCTRLREMTSMPILMLTARCGNPADILHAFNVGVDDFLKKPFNKEEFVARIRALLRRSSRRNENDLPRITHYVDKALDIDLECQEVRLDGRNLGLSPTEYNLLACLVRNMGKVVPHHQLINEVWGSAYGNPASTLTLYIFYLRKKLEDGQHGHQYIHTQWGRGYWFLPREKQ